MTRTPSPVNVFVAATGNEFMVDIAAWIVDACRASGRPTELHRDTLPAADGSINLVVAPHEFFELFPAPAGDLQHAARASVCITTEQPGTQWFELGVDACRLARGVLDINRNGVDALRSLGLDARHLQLGAVDSMIADVGNADVENADHGNADDRRPIDVLFMGGFDDRRGAALAELAAGLATRHADIRLFPFDRPVSATTPGLVFGREKYLLLASAKVLVNIHRERAATASGPPAHYFEWARMVEAMANGCVVVSEHSEQHEPLRADVEFVATDLDGLSDAVESLLSDDAARRRIADAAKATVTGPLALHRTLPPMLDDLDDLARVAASASQPVGRWRFGASSATPPVRLGPFRPVLRLQERAKELALADSAFLRRIDQVTCELHHGSTQHVERATTPGYDESTPPRVSAIVTLYNYEAVVDDALSSLASSVGTDVEIVVVDDHSTDGGRAVVRAFMDRHPELPIVLLAKDANEGLAAARNDAFDAARGEYVFVLDADNQVYPTCLARLAETLDAAPDAAATYSILEDFGSQRNVRSAFEWDPARLCIANYIDAQAMWRRSDWERLGGYRADDDHVFGWEDWDLWLRLADAGGHAVLRREILGRYRVQPSSMISLTNLATDAAIADLRTRYPALPWPGVSAVTTTLAEP